MVAKHYALYHRVNHVSTPPLHWAFMLIVIGVVLVGLPLALATIFHLVLPLVGKHWGGCRRACDPARSERFPRHLAVVAILLTSLTVARSPRPTRSGFHAANTLGKIAS